MSNPENMVGFGMAHENAPDVGKSMQKLQNPDLV